MTLDVAVQPAALVTVTVYVVVDDGVAVGFDTVELLSEDEGDQE